MFIEAENTTPGWYADPWGQADWRWWDGQQWSSAIRSTRTPRKNRWVWILVGAGCVIAVLAVIGAVIALMSGPAPVTGFADDWTYSEDFTEGPGRLDVWDDALGSGTASAGRYLLSNRNPDMMLESTIELPGPYRARVRTTAALDLVSGDPKDLIGLVAVRSDGEEYTFLVSSEQGAALSGPGLTCSSTPIEFDGAGQFALEVGGMPILDEGVAAPTVIGYVAGEPVVTCIDDAAGQVEFTWVGLVLHTANASATLAVDDFAITAYKY